MYDTELIPDPAVVVDGVGKKYPISGAGRGARRSPRLHFRAEYVDALRDISFAARKGESIGIIGRNCLLYTSPSPRDS